MKTTKNITYSAMIAAIYVLLSFIAKVFGLDSGVIQVRISEALCVLPCFLPQATVGITLGCLIFNFLAGATVIDIIFGTLATFLGAVFTRKLRHNRYLALVPPIAANTLIIPFVLKFSYGIPESLLYFMLTVGIGEIISVGLLGSILYTSIKKSKLKF